MVTCLSGPHKTVFLRASVGTDKASGVSFPDLRKIADAFGLKYYISQKNAELEEKLPLAMSENGPVLFELFALRTKRLFQRFCIKREDGSMESKPFEDMAPFLDRDEFKAEMIVSPLDP